MMGETSGDVPFEAALKDANVTLSSLVSGQRESLILGNGDLYGIVWEKDGSPTAHGGLYMRVTKNDIWDARIDTSQDPPLPKVDVRNNTVSGATRAPPSYRRPYPQPRCAAALRLGFSTAAQAKAVLDLRRAVATVNQSEQSETKIRVLAHRNVVLIQSPEPVILEPISAKTLPDAETGKTDGIAWLHAKLPGDLDYRGMQYALAVAGRGNLTAVSVVTSFDIQSGDVRQSAIALARQTVSEEEADLIERHERSWHEFWSRSGIELADRDMQRWWYRLLYFARTISRPGAAPPGLMPPLATDATPWHADYHLYVMFNIAKARLSMPEAVTASRAWFKSRELPNGLFLWKGHAHGTFMAESIGVVALITELLMQSVDDTIRVFPCWPEDQDAAFADLRAQGGFLVSAKYTNRQVQYVTVKSTVDGRLRLLSPWKTINVNGKETATGADAVVQLEAKGNEIFRFTPGKR